MSVWDEAGQFILTAGGTAVALRWAGFRFWKEKQKPLRAICGCEHHFAMHDLRTGECHDFVNGDPVKFDRYGSVTARKKVQCPCRHYTGPIPVDLEFRPPPIMPRDDSTSG